MAKAAWVKRDVAKRLSAQIEASNTPPWFLLYIERVASKPKAWKQKCIIFLIRKFKAEMVLLNQQIMH